jgi:deoxyribose-phosphate aldolase
VDSNPDALARRLELPLLAPVLSEEQVHAGLLIAREYALGSVCVRPCDVDLAARGLSMSEVRLCAAVSYPDGSSTTGTKLYEARDALRRGARELAVVVNLGMMYSRQFVRVETELLQLAELCREAGARLKAVFEFSVLNHELRIIACKLSRRTGVDVLVNSTGRVRQESFDAEIETALERRFGKFEVQAVGAVETPEEALALLARGVWALTVRRPEELLEAYRRSLAASGAAET